MKILITPRSFGKYNLEDIKMKLDSFGIDYNINDLGRSLNEDEMIDALKDVDGVVVGVDPINKKVLEAAPNLKAIAKYGVGLDNIDLDYCKEKSIKISKTIGANSNAVADYTFALLLAVARKVVLLDRKARENDYSKVISTDVYGKKIGVLGLGAIGKGVVKRAAGFGMDIYGYDIYEDKGFNTEYNVKFASVEEILNKCDFVTLHLPLVKDTKHIINKDNLNICKRDLILINTARGGLINEKDLYKALSIKQILGAGLDVFENQDKPYEKLLELDNVVLGNHTAASTMDATNNMTNMALENLLTDLEFFKD